MSQEDDPRRGAPAAGLPSEVSPAVAADGRRCLCGQRSWHECPDQPGWLECQKTISNQALAFGVSLGFLLNILLLIALDLMLDPLPLVDLGNTVSKAMGVSEKVGVLGVAMAFYCTLPLVFSALAYVWLKRRALTAKNAEVRTGA
jgi:hypothetical protein